MKFTSSEGGVLVGKSSDSDGVLNQVTAKISRVCIGIFNNHRHVRQLVK